MLVCYGCHQTIDRDKLGEKYSAELLLSWKNEHEERIVRVTGVDPSRKSHVILYGSRIGEVDSPLQPSAAVEALFPDRNPSMDRVISLSPSLEHNDHEPDFWETEANHLRRIYERTVRPLISESSVSHFSVFGLADIPLLVLLGTLFTDKLAVTTYQLHRNPSTWRWQNDEPTDFEFRLSRPENIVGEPVLVLSLSAVIDRERVRTVIGSNVAVWELTITDPHNDFLRSERQLQKFKAAVRKTMAEIKRAHNRQPVHIFPAIPVSCAVELGRARMPKADPPWILYDENPKLHGFGRTLTIGQTNEPNKE